MEKRMLTDDPEGRMSDKDLFRTIFGREPRVPVSFDDLRRWTEQDWERFGEQDPDAAKFLSAVVESGRRMEPVGNGGTNEALP